MTKEKALSKVKGYLTDLLPSEGYDEVEEIIKALKQEPCEDAVSRQAVLETLDDMDNVLDEDRTIKNYKELLKECYEVLPPVNPQPKTGHWVNRHIIANTSIDMIVCSKCGEEFSYDAETGISEYNYCPNCGAKMVEPQESEDKE